MTTNKKPYKPQARPVKDVIARCQKGIRIYPARFALTDKAFEKIKTSGNAPKLPESIAQTGEDYDLRRLRDGFVYIFAVNAEVEECFPISAKAAAGQAWYIYRYRSKDVDFNQGNNAFGVNYAFSFIDDYEAGYAEATLSKPYIELNEAITGAYFMFSDIELPMSLLRKIETDATVRAHWMTHIQLKNPQGNAVDIATLQQTVKDFSPQTNMMTDKSFTANAYRFTPVGKPDGWEDIANQLTHGKGVIVALEDPVGTARDLSGYHLYLSAQREMTLAKYEYAISTARIIDAHALQQYQKAVEDGRRSANTVRFGVMPGMQSQPRSYKPKAFPEFYKTAFSDYLNAEHLKTNGDNDIFNLLKSELELDDELPGVNAINKMAYVPSRFGTPFKYLVNAHSAFILSQRQKLTALYDIYRTGSEDAKAVEAWCYYMHGLCHGLDISAYGRNALIAALPIPDEREPFNLPPYSQQSSNATEALKTFFSNLSKELDAITKVAQNVGFNIAAYDLFVEIIVDKVYVRYAGKAHKKYAGSTFRLAEQILETYEVNLSSGKITPKGATTINSAKVPNHVKRLEERTKMVLQRVKKTPVPRQYELFQVTDKLAGLSKMLSGTVVLSFFTENNKQTWEGELANHPVLNSLHVIAGLYAPKGGLERHTAQALSDLDMVLTNQNLKQAKWLSYYNQRGIGSALTRIRNAIMNTNTALAGIGVLFELGNWAEADYKGDEVGKTAALLGMSGGLAIEGAIGALGLLAGSTKMAAGTVAVLTGLSYAVLGIGVVLITLAVIYDYFTPEDIELWMQNGFWGNSKNYWGGAVSDKSYEWTAIRSEKFKAQIDKGIFQYLNGYLSITDVVNYYHIEMQRYFNSGAEIVITVDKTDKHKLLIAYPGIYREQDAKAIKIRRITGIARNTKQVYPSWEDWRLSLEQNKIRYTLTFEQEGLAGLRIENDKLPYMNITTYSEEVDMGEYPYEELLALEIEVSVPHFRDSKYEKRKSTRLEFK